MTDAVKEGGTRFPFINLEKAVARAKELYEADGKGREMAIVAAFTVWKYSEKSSGGFQTIGALKMYGLLKDSGGGDSRKLQLTDEALRYFRDERPEEKVKLAKVFAIRPKLIGSLWKSWGDTPPADPIARSHLKAERGLNDQAARSLLSIYKENLKFAELKGYGKGNDVSSELTEPLQEPENPTNPVFSQSPTAVKVENLVIKAMPGERELTTGLLAKNASFRLLVTGAVGVKEIDRLIAKLTLDREILGEADDEDDEAASAPSA